MKNMDAGRDPYKYLMFMHVLLDAAVRYRDNPAYTKNIIQESSAFLTNFDRSFVKAGGEALHNVYHSYTQLFVELGYEAAYPLRVLRV